MPERHCQQCDSPYQGEASKYCSSCGAPRLTRIKESNGRTRRWVTVVFADIVGFTALSELHEPDEIGTLLDQILYPLTRKSSSKKVVSLINTSVTLSWHSLVPTLPHIMMLQGPYKAALRMQDRITQLSHQFEKEFGQGIQLRVGINTGKVLAGPIGAPPYRNLQSSATL